MFFYYDAGKLAVDKSRPWQIISEIGCLCGKFATEEQAKTVVDALIVDEKAGVLPCNLSKWDKSHLFNS